MLLQTSTAPAPCRYANSFGADGSGEGVLDRNKTVQLVDVFYSLVTDIYEWGWGQSFHFSPGLPGKGWRQSEAAHEARIAAVIQAKPGDKILDCGCGVGGPVSEGHRELSKCI